MHGVDAASKPVLVRPSVARDKLLELIASLPPCLIGMEACSGAHHWRVEFDKLGHTRALMAPSSFAIASRASAARTTPPTRRLSAKAVTRPQMRFVPLKSADQQGQLMVHRARQGFIEQRTATLNRIRGLLSIGHRAAPQSRHRAPSALQHLEDLPGWAKHRHWRPAR